MRPLVVLAASAVCVFAQLAPSNDSGVSMGHIHLVVADPEGQKKAWIDAFGAENIKAGPLDLLKLPGIFVIVSKGMPNGGSNGSTANHIGIAVKDYSATKARLEAAGVKMQELTPNQQMFATFPEDIRVEVMEVREQAALVAFHHMHLSVPDPGVTREWYVKTFGAMAGSRRNLPAAMIPGGEVDFLKAQMPPAPTKGRSLDHIGFEVKNLEAFIKKLQADGITMDMPYTDMTQRIGLKIAFLTDPVGTRIELTEGLAAK
ncbi:MAG TPA: VOC family protein [Bryobacteraceae bacterium]|jgi:catechol 2,3-dioxygenase-like lactoylglutathione lyase family enzyme